ncbi:MAG: DUF1491 family protein [Sphingobium sp.]
MSDRLPSKILVSALVRRVGQAGGFATIIARGEDMGGAIIVQLEDRGSYRGLLERTVDWDDKAKLIPCGPPVGADSFAVSEYIERRRANDPDLWVVELDIADGERFAAETIAIG